MYVKHFKNSSAKYFLQIMHLIRCTICSLSDPNVSCSIEQIQCRLGTNPCTILISNGSSYRCSW